MSVKCPLQGIAILRENDDVTAANGHWPFDYRAKAASSGRLPSLGMRMYAWFQLRARFTVFRELIELILDPQCNRRAKRAT